MYYFYHYYYYSYYYWTLQSIRRWSVDYICHEKWVYGPLENMTILIRFTSYVITVARWTRYFNCDFRWHYTNSRPNTKRTSKNPCWQSSTINTNYHTVFENVRLIRLILYIIICTCVKTNAICMTIRSTVIMKPIYRFLTRSICAALRSYIVVHYLLCYVTIFQSWRA